VIFHSLGKILYNKRWGDDAKEDAKDTRPRAPNPVPLPAFWAEYSRRVMKTDMDRLYAELSVSVDQFVVYLHHNYPAFTDTIEQAGILLEYLSLSEATKVGGKEQHGMSQAGTRGVYQFHLAARGMLLGLPSPVTRRSQKLLKPTLWDNVRLGNENAVLARDARGHQTGLLDPASVLNSPTSLLAREVLPFLALISAAGGGGPLEANVEVLERFSTFVYPSTAGVQAADQLAEDAVPSSGSDLEPLPAVVDPSSTALLAASSSSSAAAVATLDHHIDEALDDDDDSLWFVHDDDIVD